MIISFQRKFIFVAIPKTAGQSIRQALRPALADNDWEQCSLFEKKYFPLPSLANLGHGHISCQQIEPLLLPNLWQACFKFCFVRNPYDRFISYCHFINRNNQRMHKDPSGFMKGLFQNEKAQQRILFRPQHEFITDTSGKLMVDYLGHYENLQLDFSHICQQIGWPTDLLPKANVSNHKGYTEYYDDELQQQVLAYYHADFEQFGYSVTL